MKKKKTWLLFDSRVCESMLCPSMDKALTTAVNRLSILSARCVSMDIDSEYVAIVYLLNDKYYAMTINIE